MAMQVRDVLQIDQNGKIPIHISGAGVAAGAAGAADPLFSRVAAAAVGAPAAAAVSVAIPVFAAVGFFRHQLIRRPLQGQRF